MNTFNHEIWGKDVSKYVLVNSEDGKKISEKHLLKSDAALLNRIYGREKRGQEWRELDWKKKTSK